MSRSEEVGEAVFGVMNTGSEQGRGGGSKQMAVCGRSVFLYLPHPSPLSAPVDLWLCLEPWDLYTVGVSYMSYTQ